MEKEFGDLSQFIGRDVELFRSSDLNNTAIYFTEVSDSDRKTASAYFELLRFELFGGSRQIYIRFPHTDYFVEMVDGGVGNAHGDMKESSGRNAWEGEYSSPFTIYSHGDNLLLSLGGHVKINFMVKVAEYGKGNPYNRPYPDETKLNYPEIETALSMKYLKIPESIRKIQYCFKTKDSDPKYLLVDCPAYNSQHEKHRFFLVENDIIKQYPLKHFIRYRDGGTTIIAVFDDDGKVHNFFSPTPFPEKKLVETWDEQELESVSEQEKMKLIELLKLDLIIDN